MQRLLQVALEIAPPDMKVGTIFSASCVGPHCFNFLTTSCNCCLQLVWAKVAYNAALSLYERHQFQTVRTFYSLAHVCDWKSQIAATTLCSRH